jgi:hypothetical protein
MAKKTTKAAAKAPAKISPSKKPRTKGELYSTIAEHTQLSRKQVASVFDTMGRIIAADLTKGASEVLNIAGLMKVTVVRKPVPGCMKRGVALRTLRARARRQSTSTAGISMAACGSSTSLSVQYFQPTVPTSAPGCTVCSINASNRRPPRGWEMRERLPQ